MILILVIIVIVVVLLLLLIIIIIFVVIFVVIIINTTRNFAWPKQIAWSISLYADLRISPKPQTYRHNNRRFQRRSIPYLWTSSRRRWYQPQTTLLSWPDLATPSLKLWKPHGPWDNEKTWADAKKQIPTWIHGCIGVSWTFCILKCRYMEKKRSFAGHVVGKMIIHCSFGLHLAQFI